MSVATKSFLDSLKSAFPDQDSPYLASPWYLAAAVAFAASNEPEGVTKVFEYALEDLNAQSASESDRILLVRKLKVIIPLDTECFDNF